MNLAMNLACCKWISICNALLFLVLFTANFKKTSGIAVNVTKISPDPVFIEAGQPLKIKVNVHDLNTEKWNTTAFWVFSHSKIKKLLDKSSKYILLLRQIGSGNVFSHPYDLRATFERDADLLLVNTTVNDTGKYWCMYRRPPYHWKRTVDFHVIVEDPRAVQKGSLSTIYIATGSTLLLNASPTNLDPHTPKLGVFWDFRASATDTVTQTIRLISAKASSIESSEPRASLQDNRTLVLSKAEPNDSGTYYFRVLTENRSIRIDFNVIVAEKPRAVTTCHNVVSLIEGDEFSCLCKAVTDGRSVSQASWSKGGYEVGGQKRPSEKILSFQRFSKNLAGTYICRASFGTLVDEQRVEITVIQSAHKVKECLMEPVAWYMILASGVGGVFFGIVVTIGIQCIRERIRTRVPRYEEPIEVASPYEELDMSKKDDENFYQPLRKYRRYIKKV